ncbi:MAG TPA: hypothetical protein VG537_07270 [Candidatus Kapabacteria bacterium]|nr:hypothetical protein [Candidatus Kapabacteria bacterium]
MKKYFLLFILLVLCSQAKAQLRPDELTPDSYVKLVMNDSSEFYVLVLMKPLPDRIIVETRNGRLEIPLDAISYAIDYRYNWVQKNDLKSYALKNTADAQKYGVTQFLTRPKLPDISIVATKQHDIYEGNRYLFNDSAHVILWTPYGNLVFKYPEIDYVDNWSGQNDRREVFETSTYLTVKDPLASQDFLMPTARAYGQDHGFLLDYMLAGLQVNYGFNDWVSLNAGGVFAPFLTPTITTGTAGIKITPVQSDLFTVAFGAQGVYSEVSKITRIGFPFVVATYGTWESELTLLGGISYQSTTTVDSITNKIIPYYPVNSVIGVGGDMRVGENLKVAIELYFISDFGIVPTIASIRYFQNNLTIDAGIVFSLYKAGSSNLKTLGDYVFNTPNFPIIPMVSGSYHF